MARLKHAGDSALLAELDEVIDPEVNARAIATAAALRARAIPGVRDVISTFRSVAIHFDPLTVDLRLLTAAVEAEASAPLATPARGRSIEVAVHYGGDAGPDLAEIAAGAGLRPDEVVDRHSGVDYRVFMLGFLPGFAYMGMVPERIAAPRRAVPRLRVPGGSVGIAGRQTAVYPRGSPGGWQIIGHTDTAVFDPSRTPASLFAPGDSVRFVRAGGRTPPHAVSGDSRSQAAEFSASTRSGRGLTVLRPGLLTTVQDSGRWGHGSDGVPVSGAMDLPSHRLANALVGNARNAATLEATLVGPELRFDAPAILAITGADLAPSLDGLTVPLNAPIACSAGGVLRFGERRQGARAYVAVDGGIAVSPILGSRATHLLSAMGGHQGRALRAGDWIPLGDAASSPSTRRVESTASRSGREVRLRVLRGPQDDFFPEDAFDALQRTRFRVASQSDRMGYRLEGGAIRRVADREMISDATFTGAIQVPPSGEPILLMADRQTTGGYPQIATVITADLPLAAQLAPGDWIEFQVCSRAEALSALVALEGKLLAFG